MPASRDIALFKVNHIGDNVVFLPVVQALRQRRPDLDLTLFTDPRLAPLYGTCIPAGRLVLIGPDEMKRAWRQPRRFFQLLQPLRQHSPQACLVSYDQSSSAHALAWLSRAPIRVGADGLRIRLRGTLTRAVGHRPGESIAQWNWEMIRALLEELDGQDGADAWPATPPPPDLTPLIAGVVRLPDRVVLHAGSKWTYTRWPLERFAALAAALAQDCEVCWVKVPETQGVPLAPAVRTITTDDLPALARLLASAALFVGNNSGPMHLANAVGTPVVVVSGPSHPAWTPCWHASRVRLLRATELNCLPCDRLQYAAYACTRREDPLACMHRWSVAAVEAACREMLSTQPTE